MMQLLDSFVTILHRCNSLTHFHFPYISRANTLPGSLFTAVLACLFWQRLLYPIHLMAFVAVRLFSATRRCPLVHCSAVSWLPDQLPNVCGHPSKYVSYSVKYETGMSDISCKVQSCIIKLANGDFGLKL